MKLILLFSVIGLLLLSGCALVPRGTSEETKVETASVIVEKAIPYIRGFAQTAVKLSLQYAEKDPIKRDLLRVQIHIVSDNLQSLLDRGNFSPREVTDTLKIKEEYVDSILGSVSFIYSAFYDKLKENDQADLSIRILRSLAEGVKEGTN